MQKHEQSHPLSTMCVSSCGSYCVAGNLKGEVITFDFRHLKQPLNMRRVHDHAVIRVAFIPAKSAEPIAMENNPVELTNVEGTRDSECRSRDSFSTATSSLADVGLQETSIMDVNTSINRRDSWASLINFKMPNNMSMNDSQMSRLSIGSDAGRRSLPGLVELPSANASPVDVADAISHKVRLGRRGSLAIMRSLEEIHEEQSHITQSTETTGILMQPHAMQTTRSIPLAVNSVSKVTPNINATEPTAFAKFFERMVVKRKADEILGESVVFNALKGIESLRHAYRHGIECSLDSVLSSKQEYLCSSLNQEYLNSSVNAKLQAMQNAPELPVLHELNIDYLEQISCEI